MGNLCGNERKEKERRGGVVGEWEEKREGGRKNECKEYEKREGRKKREGE